MATNNQFSIGIHVMVALGKGQGREVCSSEIALSVNANPSFVRRILSKLSKANLVRTASGKGGHCSLAKPAKEITLLDIYRAVDAPMAFAIHSYPVQKACAISCSIKPAMERVLQKSQKSLEVSLKAMSLAEVMSDIKGR